MKRPASLAAQGLNPVSVAWLAGAWIALLSNWPLWQALHRLPDVSGPRGRLFILGFAAMITAATAFCLSLAAWRRTLKPVVALFLLSAAAGAYFMGSYGTVIDGAMLRNVLQTDLHETRDLLSPRLGLVMLGLAGLPLLLLWRTRLAACPPWAQARRNLLSLAGALALLAVLLMVFFADMSSTMRNHKSLRYLINPLASFYSLGRLATASQAGAGPVEAVGSDAHLARPAAGQRPPLLVLVVGETARASNFSLNGYPRTTNPELAALQVLSFRRVSSCGTSTAASVPCMFSSLGKSAFESEAHRHENLLDVVQHAGMAVLWLDNQAGCKGVCERVASVQVNDTRQSPGGLPEPLCHDGECLDEALLHDLDARIAALPAARRAQGILLVMHQMGSHGPAYSKRSPAGYKRFVPECETNQLQQCERQSVLNAYDNSIAYTDHMLARTIAWLNTRQEEYAPALLYLSDHGESLGENNLYLHGMPYAIAPQDQTHVPMVFWTSPGLAADDRLDTACLRQKLDTPLSHDNLFHTVLGLLQVQSTVYHAAQDAFAACRESGARPAVPAPHPDEQHAQAPLPPHPAVKTRRPAPDQRA